MRRLLTRGLGRLLARLIDRQEAFNSRQVQFDNALLDYIDARLEATHRHYDAMLGIHGRHMGEIDERHLILQEELVAHVHDLVKRIDLVLASRSAGRLGLELALRDVRARLLRLEERTRARMKTVLVCGVQAPFITGGAEILVSELRTNLERRGFRADVANVPFKWYPVSELVRQALAWRLLDVTESNGTPVDLVIPTKFPSYLVRHPRKVAWLFHQHREAYDLFGTPVLLVHATRPEDRQVREAIHTMDDAALGECRAIYTISRNVADRLRRYNGLPGTPLYPPPHHLGRYRDDGPTATTSSTPAGSTA